MNAWTVRRLIYIILYLYDDILYNQNDIHHPYRWFLTPCNFCSFKRNRVNQTHAIAYSESSSVKFWNLVEILDAFKKPEGSFKSRNSCTFSRITIYQIPTLQKTVLSKNTVLLKQNIYLDYLQTKQLISVKKKTLCFVCKGGPITGK